MSDDENDVPELSARLQGVADALTVRIATLLATELKGVRLTPSAMDEIRLYVGVATRGAALEGARSADATRAALLPVPKVGRAQAQEMKATRLDTRQQIPSATPTLTRIPALPAGLPPPPPPPRRR